MIQPARTFGEIRFKEAEEDEDGYKATAFFEMTLVEPHTAITLKQVFSHVSKSELDRFTFPATSDSCHNLLWFMDRYPMRMGERCKKALTLGRKKYHTDQRDMEKILSDAYIPRDLVLKSPHKARPYQLRGAEIYLRAKKMLLCDWLGLGKSLTATLSFYEPKTLPALVVCQTHLPTQWKENTIERFTNLSTHIIRVGKVYDLPPADVYIISYSKLAKWGPLLHGHVKSIIFDECQELRRRKSDKYAAAANLSEKVEYILGLSGSPIYNYGIEMFNILDCIKKGCVGEYDDFGREWGYDEVRNPKALGTWLREKFLMLRRTDKEVGRELPELNTVIKTVEYDESEVAKSEEIARQIAQSYLKATDYFVKGKLGLELDRRARQNTGIAKAHHVAAMVKMILDYGKPVVLSGWHRDVYKIWLKDLKEYNPVMYTGSESAKEKNRAVQMFITGQTDLFIISNRSGVGLDGLQDRCRDVVIGELDYSPQVHKQIIGRILRDGQQERCTVYYPICEFGSDPPIIEVLGIKSDQSHGILDPMLDMPQRHTDNSRIQLMAEAYLKKHHNLKEA